MERLQEIAERKQQIKKDLEANTELDFENIKAELDALDEEERNLNQQLAEKKKAEQEAEERAKVEAALKRDAEEQAERRKFAEEINERKIKGIELKGNKKMEIEVRNTPEYIDAYAEYIKTGKAEQCRTLLTENVGGTIAIPDFVYDEVKTAWESEKLLQYVKKTYFKGGLKVNFEISSSGATKHLEGSAAVSEEELIEGIASIDNVSFKKWISISDEVYDLRGEAFLRYIYSELGYRIAKAVADEVVAVVSALTTSGSSTSPKQAAITSAPAIGTVAEALGNLSDEANNPIIVMNKATWSKFKEAQYTNNYFVDPFEGLPVVFNNSLPTYNSADANAVYMIVGDFGDGTILNLPNGIEGIEYKFDNMTRKKEDLIEVLGRMYAGVGAVACMRFCQVKKPAASV